jgi:hypothetical protein
MLSDRINPHKDIGKDPERSERYSNKNTACLVDHLPQDRCGSCLTVCFLCFDAHNNAAATKRSKNCFKLELIWSNAIIHALIEHVSFL